MISYKEYLAAKKIVDSYENQFQTKPQTCCDEPLIERELVNNNPPGVCGVTTIEFVCKNCGRNQMFF
jgi:hypothetical protein